MSGVTMSTDRTARALALAPAELFIDGVWRPSSSGETFAVHNPATGEVLTQVASATPDDGMAALAAADGAASGWARTPARERSELLRRAYDLLMERADDFAALMTIEMGKPLAEARGEVTYGGEFLRWFAEEAVRINGRYSPSPEGTLRMLTVRRPVGTALFITPWNFPLAMATRKIAPALAAGCTTILKPAALTPLTSLAFVRLLEEVGVPQGVVNVIPTEDAQPVTGPIIRDRRLRKLSFTGSTAVGMALLEECAGNVVRTSMELGGCAPFIVFDDADLGKAVESAYQTKMRNMGEACNAANTFYVQAGVADEFAERLAARLAALTVGDGLEEGTQVGPLISDGARKGVGDLVDEAVRQGAKVLTGGGPVDGPGYFYAPTVLTGVTADAAIASSEIFGPVAPVTTFETEDEVVERVNASPVGLSAYLHTGDLARVWRMTERLETGMLGVNGGTISNAAAPFGGVKHSGMGREGGPEGIEAYLETMYVGFADPFA
ncbi:NAD-dependent succinate-semialdehyde dehydrogenase [Tessaracoccus sp. ZS01]|nr:NAD-dependent succinate-semialdehyde dehydrogenase [Tessaracoccus sp. ZS01]OMG55928.1 NAD-dependent succinate-semialdehyde dehydrogenase [Tessaracoccus sp. ZS01]